MQTLESANIRSKVRAMVPRPKLLILDDEQDILDVYQQLLAGLSSAPEVLAATAGARALALLESEPFSLLVTDLKMPNMDGFQVLAIVRRRFPSLRIVVLTGTMEPQFRARAYALGIDLFVEKPKSQKETQLFLDCVESLLERDIQQTGFRGIQHKALVDILQMECLTRSSVVLKITSGGLTGQIWLRDGDIIDAVTGDWTAESAFREILSWKVGNFELLPADPGRPRTMLSSAQGLLLDTAQMIDEANAEPAADAESEPQSLPKLAQLGRTPGVEFILAQKKGGELQQWSCENAKATAAWAVRLFEGFRGLGEKLKTGAPTQIEGYGVHQHIAISAPESTLFVAGFNHAFSQAQVRNAFKQLLSKWGS